MRTDSKVWEFSKIVVLAGLLLCSAIPSVASATIDEFIVPTANSGPSRIIQGPDGNLWFTERYGNNIGRVTPGGVVTEYAIPTANSQPMGIASGPDGNLWFTEEGGTQVAKIGRITPSGIITEFSLPAANSCPSDITAGSDGNLWFTEYCNLKIGRITPTGVITEFSVSGWDPYGITSGPDGNLWFTDMYGNLIGRITPDGVVTEFNIPTAQRSPSYITSGPDGNLWFSETYGYNGTSNFFSIGRVTPAGIITEFTIPTPGQPQGLTVGPDGDLWFCAANAIGRMTTSGDFSPLLTISTQSINGGYSYCWGITAGPDGNIWFTDSGFNMIGRVNISSTSNSTPNTFTFTPQNGVPLTTTIASNSITVSGITTGSPISIIDGTYSVNGGPFTSVAGVVNNNDTVTVRVMSSGAYSTTTSAILTIGGMAGTFSVMTASNSSGSGGSGSSGGSSGSGSASATPVGYNPQWLIVTITILMLAGGYLLRRRQRA